MKKIIILLALVISGSVFAKDGSCYKAMLGKTTLSMCDRFTEIKEKIINKGLNGNLVSSDYGSYGYENHMNFDDDKYRLYMSAYQNKIYEFEIARKYHDKPNYSNIVNKLIKKNNNIKPLLRSTYVQADYHKWIDWCWGDCTYWKLGQGDIYTQGKPLDCKTSGLCMLFRYLHTPSEGAYELRIKLENNRIRNEKNKASEKYDKEQKEKAINEF